MEMVNSSHPECRKVCICKLFKSDQTEQEKSDQSLQCLLELSIIPGHTAHRSSLIRSTVFSRQAIFAKKSCISLWTGQAPEIYPSISPILSAIGLMQVVNARVTVQQGSDNQT